MGNQSRKLTGLGTGYGKEVDFSGYKIAIVDTIPISDAIGRLSKADPNDVQAIATSEIELLFGYYSLVLRQAKKSFNLAIIASGIGFTFFIVAVSFVIWNQYSAASTISLISGALIEVISGINFYLYGRSSSQLGDFLHQLNDTQRFLLANSMCENLSGDNKEHARIQLISTISRMRPSEDTQARKVRRHRRGTHLGPPQTTPTIHS